MRPVALVAAAALAVGAGPTSSLAAEPGWQPASSFCPPRAAEPGGYAWQLLVADALSVGALAWGIDRDRTDLVVGGTLGFALGGPAIHALHGRGRTGLHSLGRRVGAPLAAGYLALRVAEAACEGGDTRCGAQWGLGGLAVGGLVAVMADLLHWDEDVAVAPMAARDARGSTTWGLALVARR